MNEYLVTMRYKGVDQVLESGTLCDLHEGLIFYGNRVICREYSEVGKKFFTYNEDGLAVVRRELIEWILETLSEKQKRDMLWNRVWDDHICRKLRREDYKDFWVWGVSFYKSSIEDLEYIKHLLGGQ